MTELTVLIYYRYHRDGRYLFSMSSVFQKIYYCSLKVGLKMLFYEDNTLLVSFCKTKKVQITDDPVFKYME
jgi:hypothetical protein